MAASAVVVTITQAGLAGERSRSSVQPTAVADQTSTSTVAPTRVSVATRSVVRGRSTRAAGLLLALLALGFVLLCSVAFGSKPIAFSKVIEALLHVDRTDNDHLIIRTVRLPRTAVGLLVGSALGLGGAVMQGVARNPLADPGLLGVNAGAALFVAVGIYGFGIASLSGYVWFAFAGAATTSLLVYALGEVGRDSATPVKLALAGAAVSVLCMSLTRAVLLIDLATLDQFRFWDVGSLAGRRGEIAWSVLPFILTGSVLAFGSARSLNGLAMGDDLARSLGQKVGRNRAVAALSIVLLCGSATAAAGPIAFVGLTVPHVARAIVGPDYRWVLPYSAVLAPGLLLGSDVIGRVVARPAEVEVGVITAVIGAPFFIALVRRRTLAAL